MPTLFWKYFALGLRNRNWVKNFKLPEMERHGEPLAVPPPEFVPLGGHLH
jgi:hypothetical protein